MMSNIPNARTVIAFCVVAIAGYAAFSLWAVLASNDAALRGDVGGTWKSFAVAAMGFWVGSSSGGKARDAAPRDSALPPPAPLPEPAHPSPEERS